MTNKINEMRNELFSSGYKNSLEMRSDLIELLFYMKKTFEHQLLSSYSASRLKEEINEVINKISLLTDYEEKIDSKYYFNTTKKYKEDHKKYCHPECPEQDQPSNKDK